VKNIAVGRLVTDFCKGCAHTKFCGEGIYALRAGVDGVFKPCLLRTDQYTAIDNGRSGVVAGAPAQSPVVQPSDAAKVSAYSRAAAGTPQLTYKMQILRAIDTMVGDWKNAFYMNGAPQ
jgi:hypothetical protein